MHHSESFLWIEHAAIKKEALSPYVTRLVLRVRLVNVASNNVMNDV
jgi:hypothetical protein